MISKLIGEFGMLEARLCPTEEKYLFIMSENSEGFCDTRLLLGH